METWQHKCGQLNHTSKRQSCVSGREVRLWFLRALIIASSMSDMLLMEDQIDIDVVDAEETMEHVIGDVCELNIN